MAKKKYKYTIRIRGATTSFTKEVVTSHDKHVETVLSKEHQNG